MGPGYILSFADSLTHVPRYPNRTAKRILAGFVDYKVWKSRKAMLEEITTHNAIMPQYPPWIDCSLVFKPGTMSRKRK